MSWYWLNLLKEGRFNMHPKISRTMILSKAFLFFITSLLSFFISVSSFAFTPCSETRGLVSFDIPQIQPVTKEGETYILPYQISNKSDRSLSVSVEASAIDAFYLIDPSTSKSLLPKEVLKQEVHIDPQGQMEGEFSFFVKDAYVDAHYMFNSDISLTTTKKSSNLLLS